MEIICPTCNAVYNMPQNKIPKQRASAKCKKCGGKIVVEPNELTQAEQVVQEETVREPIPSESQEELSVADQAIYIHYPELKGPSADIYHLKEILTPNKNGDYKSRKNKLKVKILNSVSGKLAEILKEGETVMRIGRGIANYPFEIFFGNGILTMIYNHYAIVCTNLRILFININSKATRPTHYLSQILYEEIKKVRRGSFFASLAIIRKKGKRRVFTYVKRYISKDLMQFINEHIQGKEPIKQTKQYLENLCPACFVPLEKGLIKCPTCEAEFKEPKKAFLKSLILPGLGDLYLGHRLLGVLEMIGSVLIWVIVISSFLAGPKELIPALILLLFYNGLDGLLTSHMAKKGYMLA